MKTIVIALALMIVAFSGGTALAKDYKATPDTLAALLPTLQPGDLVMLVDGEYNGGFEIKVSGTKEAPVHIKAEGGNAIFRGGTNCVNIEGDYVELEGIKAYGAKSAGVRVHSNYVAVRKCVCGDNGRWGIFSGFAEGIVVEDNECYGSKREHGIYLSNSADHAVVRRNHCYNNGRCGIQFNGDPAIPGGDGVMSFNLVEGNILHDNVGCFNMTCVADSIVRNNLFYGQNSKAIALWDTHGRFPVQLEEQPHHQQHNRRRPLHARMHPDPPRRDGQRHPQQHLRDEVPGNRLRTRPPSKAPSSTTTSTSAASSRSASCGPASIKTIDDMQEGRLLRGRHRGRPEVRRRR